MVQVLVLAGEDFDRMRLFLEKTEFIQDEESAELHWMKPRQLMLFKRAEDAPRDHAGVESSAQKTRNGERTRREQILLTGTQTLS